MIININITMNTIIRKHPFSLIAPQHPKKEIKKMTQPITMTRMGIVLITGIKSEMLPTETSTAMPMPTKAAPASCKKTNEILNIVHHVVICWL